ncbi:phosphoglucomutase [Hydrogenoanaerobacterium saccharovorans]|uniref:Phosphoglucomutase n=1 Tax=Hydrogenoanaerobacterium saccharovorans TaxID=474960 RepID=A0A1H8AND4_9FIRM|nr:phospho-sugar mutase [Hydrogenoanaerobacterium saccharovorans]RPF47886.1 phosphoglucomutase [Hydrogenoanaerobacterium saccharovorans]SEM71279.1 phosphoglucomutase [Hydrogenoanaerobacterium saccharovorans]
MSEKSLYLRWLEKACEDKDLHEELVAIAGKDDEIFDRFYRELEFGTAGLRGVIGAGTNRMNIYTVRKATQGLAAMLCESCKQPSVAISYDSRIKADLFAKEAARVLAGNGVKVYLYAELMPTPALSFAVRELKCSAGIMVTASHNPAKYNGYKAYGADGCQIGTEESERVLQFANQTDLFDGVKLADFNEALAEGLIEMIPETIVQKFLDNVQAQSIRKGICERADLKVVYTPLNGAGNRCVRSILDRIGVKNVVVVPEQEKPDGNFTTCPYPNPEIREALQKGLDLCEKENPSILLATDPDCDRVGIAVNHNGSYVLLTGNEVGVLLTHYIATSRTELGTIPKNPIVVKTIVTTSMVDAMGADLGVEVVNILTGFKYIGEQIALLEEKGEQNRFLLGFEESYGYLAGTYVRDKDAVVASMLICEMTAYYKEQGMTLVDALGKLYEKYGVHKNIQSNFYCEGASGMQRMNELMSGLRANAPKEIAGMKVVSVADYQTSVKSISGKEEKITLPKSNVLAYGLQGDIQVVIRPSGTEPKIKAYYMVKAATDDEAENISKALVADVTKMLGF